MKLLILGATGHVGKTVAKHFNLKYEVFAPSLEYMDLTSKEDVFSEIEVLKPDAVLFFPTVTDEAECEKDSEKAFKANAYAAGLASVAAESVGAAFMLFSSYKVYGKADGLITEETEINPETVFGKTLSEAEKLASLNGKSYILRLGEQFDSENGMLKAFEGLVTAKGTVKISDVKKGSFISADTVANMADKLLDTAEYGVYNIASVGHASWFEFANEVFRHYDAEVHTYADEEGNFKSTKNYPDNFRLSIEKFVKLTGYKPLDWHDELKHVISEKLLLKSAENAMGEN